MQAVYNTPCDSSDVNFTKDFTRAFKYTAASAFNITYQRVSVKKVLCGSLVVSYIIAPQIDDDPVKGSVPNQVSPAPPTLHAATASWALRRYIIYYL